MSINQENKIIKNSVQCIICKDILISSNEKPKKICSCKKTIIDGGLYELIREGDSYIEKSEFYLTETLV